MYTTEAQMQIRMPHSMIFMHNGWQGSNGEGNTKGLDCQDVVSLKSDGTAATGLLSHIKVLKAICGTCGMCLNHACRPAGSAGVFISLHR